MDDDEQPHDERPHDKRPDDGLGPVRAELAEWRRRAEMAEAIANERLIHTQTAERALRSAEIALQAVERATASAPAASAAPPSAAKPPTAVPADSGASAPETATAVGDVAPVPKRTGTDEAMEPDAEQTGPKSLREWWRRYTDSLT